MSSVKIHIKDDIYTLVDSDIAERLKGKSICLSSRGSYARIYIKRKEIRLHRYVIDARPGQIVDHINRNRLDNRKHNLRLINHSGNRLNHSQKPGPSGYFHVCFHKRDNTWYSGIKFKNISKHVGCFNSKIIAALISDSARKKYSSVMPRLNFQSRLKRCHLPEVLRRTKGRIFSVVFVRRKDGAERHMTCRINVNKNVKGTGLLFEPRHMNLMGVYDVKKRVTGSYPWRMFYALPSEKEIQGDLKISKATNAYYGDLYCPSCGCWIVTPDFVFLVPGTGRCPRCRKSFKVTKEVALQSNRQQEKRKDARICL